MGRFHRTFDENNEPVDTPFTDDEEAEFDRLLAEETARQKEYAKQLAAEKKAAASGRAKLAELGLTEAEINALLG